VIDGVVTGEELSGERCVRCMQPLPKAAKRCPNCRTPRNSHAVPVLFGIVGLLALCLTIFFMARTAQEEEVSHPELSRPAQTAQ
jgi:hypothetical protein